MSTIIKRNIIKWILILYKKKAFEKYESPFYFYDLGLLKKTLETIKKESDLYSFNVHYALKANSNEEILKLIKDYGLGADCVSGNEISKR